MVNSGSKEYQLCPGNSKVFEIVIKVVTGVSMGCKRSKDFKNSYDLQDSYELGKFKKMGS